MARRGGGHPLASGTGPALYNCLGFASWACRAGQRRGHRLGVQLVAPPSGCPGHGPRHSAGQRPRWKRLLVPRSPAGSFSRLPRGLPAPHRLFDCA
eukprot:852788-Alexandrium_andersonii.AAC.1